MPTAARRVSKIPKRAPDEQKKVKAPSWPSFDPSPHVEHLAFREVCKGQIVTIPGFWTSTLCKKYIKFLSSLPLVTTPGKPRGGDAVRVNDRFQLDDPQFAERLWSETGLRELVFGLGGEDFDGSRTANSVDERWGGTAIGLNPNIRIYRYSKGQFFDQHCKYFHTFMDF